MDPNNLVVGFLIVFVALPLVCLAIFTLVAVMLVAKAMVYVKAGRPAWLSLIPIYNFVELLDIVGLSVWWGLPVPVAVAALATLLFFTSATAGLFVFALMHGVFAVGVLGLMVYVYYRLSKQFGESGWYALGYVFLPFVFFPMLGFGKAKFKGSKKKNKDTQKNKLIVTGIVGMSMVIVVTACICYISTSFATILRELDAKPLSRNCYKTSMSRAYYLPQHAPVHADPKTFVSLTPEYTTESGHCYGKDMNTVFFENVAIVGADATTFTPLGKDAFYAADKARVYHGAQVIADADPKNFTDMGHGYAKGKNVVFYASTSLSGSNNGGLLILKGADAKTFAVVEGNDLYDAKDKNRTYQYGKVVPVNPKR